MFDKWKCALKVNPKETITRKKKKNEWNKHIIIVIIVSFFYQVFEYAHIVWLDLRAVFLCVFVFLCYSLCITCQQVFRNTLIICLHTYLFLFCFVYFLPKRHASRFPNSSQTFLSGWQFFYFIAYTQTQFGRLSRVWYHTNTE